MARKKRMATLWEVPDGLWEKIEPLLEKDQPCQETGRPRVDRRRVLNAIIFRLRTGCQWNHLPSMFGSDSTVHRYFQRWAQSEIFRRIWAMLVETCDELQAVQWEWQAADGAMGKARMGGDAVGPNPTDRGKKGGQTQPAGGRRRRTFGLGGGRGECS